ncbi:hypothetical protein HK097_006696, partial [Rhizophlyctis rosea]
PEYTIHKIIFFLELCKTVGIKGESLCSVEDLVGAGEREGKREEGGVRVVRTVMAFERQARKRGWKGGVLSLDGVVSEGGGGERDRRRSKRMSHRKSRGEGEGRDKERERRRRSQARQSRVPGAEGKEKKEDVAAGGSFEPVTGNSGTWRRNRPLSTASRKSVDSLYSLYAGLPGDVSSEGTLARASLGRKASGTLGGRSGRSRSGSAASSKFGGVGGRPVSVMSDVVHPVSVVEDAEEVQVHEEQTRVEGDFSHIKGREESDDDLWDAYDESESPSPLPHQQQPPQQQQPQEIPTFPPRPAVLRVVDSAPVVVEPTHLVRQVSSYKYSGIDAEPLSAELGDTSVPTLGR